MANGFGTLAGDTESFAPDYVIIAIQEYFIHNGYKVDCFKSSLHLWFRTFKFYKNHIAYGKSYEPEGLWDKFPIDYNDPTLFNKLDKIFEGLKAGSHTYEFMDNIVRRAFTEQ